MAGCPCCSEVLARLAAIEATLNALANPRLSPARPLSREDRERLQQLLPMTVGVHANDPFVVGDLLDEDAPNEIRDLLGDLSAKQVGRLLLRATDRDVAGYTVRQLGKSAGVTWWMVESR